MKGENKMNSSRNILAAPQQTQAAASEVATSSSHKLVEALVLPAVLTAAAKVAKVEANRKTNETQLYLRAEQFNAAEEEQRAKETKREALQELVVALYELAVTLTMNR